MMRIRLRRWLAHARLWFGAGVQALGPLGVLGGALLLAAVWLHQSGDELRDETAGFEQSLSEAIRADLKARQSDGPTRPGSGAAGALAGGQGGAGPADAQGRPVALAVASDRTVSRLSVELLAAGDRAGLVLGPVEYRWKRMPGTRLRQLDIQLAGSGRYPQVRAWVASLLQQWPSAQIDELSIERADVQQPQTEFRLNLQMFFEEPSS